MELKKHDIVKHFKGETLLEKNIYKILAVNPEYTGTKEYVEDPVVIYESLFQDDKIFVREYQDLVEELSEDEKELYHQVHRLEHLTQAELDLINSPEFIQAKKAFIEEKYQNKTL